MTFHSVSRRRVRGHGATVALLAIGLISCGSESRANPEQPSNASGTAANAAQDRPDVPQNEGVAIMAAAGFDRPQGDNQWRYSEDSCESVHAEIELYRDLNGDGRPDALVKSDGDQCFGMNQRRITLLTQQGSSWRVISDFQETFGHYELHPRAGLEWPDIEMANGMDENSGCIEFLRWNGREYILGGTSDKGQICTLTDEGRAAGGPNGATPSAAAGLAFPPIEKGYYAIGQTCAQAIADGGDMISYFNERTLAAIDGALTIDGFEALGGNSYRVKASSRNELDQVDRADFDIVVNGRGSFSNVEYGDRYTHCPTDQVPRSVRQDWGDLAGR